MVLSKLPNIILGNESLAVAPSQNKVLVPAFISSVSIMLSLSLLFVPLLLLSSNSLVVDSFCSVSFFVVTSTTNSDVSFTDVSKICHLLWH